VVTLSKLSCSSTKQLVLLWDSNKLTAARVRRATINEGVFMSILFSVLDTSKWMSWGSVKDVRVEVKSRVALRRSKCAMACAVRCFKVELHRWKGKCRKCQKVYSLRWCRSVDTLFHSSLLFDHRHQCSSGCLTSRWCSAPEKVIHVIVLHSLCSTLSTSCLKQLTRYSVEMDLTSRWCSVSLFSLFVTRPRCSLMNEKVLHVIVLHSLCSTLS
jgi:hypothetical protein